MRFLGADLVMLIDAIGFHIWFANSLLWTCYGFVLAVSGAVIVVIVVVVLTAVVPVVTVVTVVTVVPVITAVAFCPFGRSTSPFFYRTTS